METTFLEGGDNPGAVQLAELLKDRPFSLEDMMTEAETSGSNPAVTGKIAKMEFRMYIRKLLNQRCMLSSMAGAAEIDAIFPMLDVNNDGEIDIEELEKRHVRTDIMRGVIDKFTGLRWTGLPPDAQGDREKFLSRSGGDHGELQGLTCRSARTS